MAALVQPWGCFRRLSHHPGMNWLQKYLLPFACCPVQMSGSLAWFLAFLKGCKGLQHLAAQGVHLLFREHGPMQGMDDVFQGFGIFGFGFKDFYGLGNNGCNIKGSGPGSGFALGSSGALF
jgi:hypothetical protein